MKDLELMKGLLAKGVINRREFLQQMAAWGLTASAASGLLSSVSFAQEPQRGGHFVVGGSGGSSVDSFDPTTFASFIPSFTSKAWGNRLLSPNPDGTLAPSLATEWSSNDDFSVWTIALRNDVMFHNDKPFTAADVVYSVQRHYGPDTTSGAAGPLADVQDVKASGDYEVQVMLAKGNIDFMYVFTDYHLVMQPEGSTDDGMGTGPFVIDTVEHGVRYTFTRNDNYFNAPMPYYDSLEILTINDTTARMASLQTGKVHAIERVDPKTVDFLKQSKNVRIENTPTGAHYTFPMDMSVNPFDKPDVVMALKYAVPRQQMVDQILSGFGTLGNDHPINSAFPLFENAVEQRPLDIEQAASLYKKSGHSGPIILRTSDVAFPGAVEAAALFQESAAQAGITLEIKREPGDGYWSDVWNVQPFYASYWAARATQDQIFSVAYRSDADWNESRFRSTEFDDLMIAARLERDTAIRATLYTQMQTLVNTQAGVIVPMFNDYVDAVAANVQGYTKNPSDSLGGHRVAENTWFG
jgi:peptide/nickel transport system substrate-binding protein